MYTVDEKAFKELRSTDAAIFLWQCNLLKITQLLAIIIKSTAEL